MQGAEARAIAEMRHRRAFLCRLRRERGEAARDVFEGEPMKTVAADAALFKMPGDGKAARRRRQVVMEGGIEAGDLRQPRLQRSHRPDRCQTARLVKGRKRYQCFQRRESLVGDHDGAGKIAPAMNDAMAYGGKSTPCEIILDPSKYIGEQAVALSLAGGAALLEQLLA